MHDVYSYGVSDRGASVRIPWQVEVDKKGYIEDRRPNANIDPYIVTRLIVEHLLHRPREGRPGLIPRSTRRPRGAVQRFLPGAFTCVQVLLRISLRRTCLTPGWS